MRKSQEDAKLQVALLQQQCQANDEQHTSSQEQLQIAFQHTSTLREQVKKLEEENTSLMLFNETLQANVVSAQTQLDWHQQELESLRGGEVKLADGAAAGTSSVSVRALKQKFSTPQHQPARRLSSDINSELKVNILLLGVGGKARQAGR